MGGVYDLCRDGMLPGVTINQREITGDQMSFFGIFGFGKKGTAAAVDRSKKCYIVDCATMESSRGERTRMAPRNQLDILRRFSRFVKKEQVELWAVFDGKELRDAPDGKKFMDVMVCYAARAADVPQVIGKMCAGRKTGACLVITADKAVEQIAQRHGAALMHSSTFRKALEADGGSSFGGGERPSGRDRDRSQGRRGRQGGSGQRRPPRQNAPDSADRKPPQRPEESSAQQPEEKTPERPRNDSADAVSELIDLV